MGRAIFISYRRDDTEGEAGRLFDDLVRAFGEDCVFMDVAGINPGTDFRKAIDDNVSSCGVLLAVLGPRWASVENTSGQRRLEDPNDFVRLEVASALARNIAVIPVLVHDAKMPHPDQLPEGLKDLAYRNSVEITHARWNSDVQLLTKALRQYVTSSSYTNTEPVHATVAVQLPAPTTPAPEPAAPKNSRTPLIAGLSVAAVLLVAIVAFVAMRASSHTNPNPPVITPVGPSHRDHGGDDGGNGAAASTALTGTWTSPNAAGRNTLAKVEISGSDRRLTIHAWGNCADCDWGTQMASVEGTRAIANWTFPSAMGGELPGRVANVTLDSASTGQLDVKVVNTYPNHPGSERRARFVRAQ